MVKRLVKHRRLSFVILRLSEEDMKKVENFKIYYNAFTGYYTCYSKIDKDAPPIYLHHLIKDVPKGLVGDHIDGDLNNCTGANIQVITQQDNTRKKNKHETYAGKPTTSKHKGNSWNKRLEKWYVYIRVNDVLLNLGNYENPDLAAVVYNIYARFFFRKYVNLNRAKVTKELLAQIDFAKLNQRARKNLSKHGRFADVALLNGLA